MVNDGYSSDEAMLGMGNGSSDSDCLPDAVNTAYGVPTAFGGTRARRPRKRARTAAAVSEQFDMEETIGGQNVGAGAWEKYTRGIGSKLLKKMGFTGQLGVRGNGLVEPIEVKIRANPSAGLGRDSVGVVAKEDATEKDTVEKQSGPRWKKKRSKAKVGVEKIVPPKERILDMRTKDVCEVSNVADMVKRRVALFAAPELVHNVQLLLDGVKVELENAQRARETEKVIGVNAEREEIRLRIELNNYSDSLRQERRLQAEMIALGDAKDDAEFVRLLEDSTAIMHECTGRARYCVRDAVSEVSEMRIRGAFRTAIGGSNVDVPRRMLNALRDALFTSGAYVRLCARSILGEARAYAFVPEKDGGRFAGAMDAVRDTLPSGIRAAFIDDVLLPALEASVRRASRDSAPHTWAYEWLPVVGGDALEPLLGVLRSRFSRELARWRVDGDRESLEYAQRDIRAWIRVLPRRKVQAIVDTGVLRNIAAYLRVCDDEKSVRCVTKIVQDWIDLTSTKALADTIAPSLWAAVRKSRDMLFDPQTTAHCVSICVKEYKAWKNAVWKLGKHVRPILAGYLFVIEAHTRSRDVMHLRVALREADVKLLAANAYRRQRQSSKVKEQRTSGNGQRLSIVDAVNLAAEKKGLSVLENGRDVQGSAVYKIGSVCFVVDGTRQVLLLLVKRDNNMRVLQPISVAHLLERALNGGQR